MSLGRSKTHILHSHACGAILSFRRPSVLPTDVTLMALSEGPTLIHLRELSGRRKLVKSFSHRPSANVHPAPSSWFSSIAMMSSDSKC